MNLYQEQACEDAGSVLEWRSPVVCAKCAEQGGTCCSLAPGNEEFCFPVTQLEWERILDCMGDKGGFVEQMNSQSFVNNIKRLFPMDNREVDRLFPLHRAHLRLATTRKGKCSFLDRDGCVLPREVRPYYCRIFPLWIYGERLAMFEPSGCLACRRTRTPGGLLELMGTTESAVRTLHGQLRLAWGLDPVAGSHFFHTSLVRGGL